MRDRLMSLIRGPGLLVLGLWLLFVASSPGRNGTIDTMMRQIVARQLWTAGTVAVNVIPPEWQPFPWIPAGPQRWVAPYGVGQVLLFVPFDMVGALLERVSPPAWREQVRWLPIGFILLPLLGVGLWLALRALLREWGLPNPWPVVGASVMMLATLLFHYVGDPQEETLVALCVTLAVLFALRLRRQPTWRLAALIGLCAGGALMTRSVAIFALAIVPVLVLSAVRETGARIRLLAVVGATSAALVAILLWYNHARFGSPFTVGYDRLGQFGEVGLDGRTPKAIASLLLGPGAGLLILSPALLVVVFGAGELWRRDRWYAVGTLLAVGSCYLFFGCWHHSYAGGFVWSTRYQTHLITILALPVTLALRRLFASPGTRRATIAVLAVSIVIQVLSVIAHEGMEYYQASCEPNPLVAMDEPMRNSPIHGQLGRRVENVARWALRRPPRLIGDANCQATQTIMWDRYMPNFWGPVYAHRIARGGGALVVFWFAMLAASVAMVAVGLRRALAQRD